MHSEELALRRAMCDAPDDDAPRLVLADWYDEHGGDSARAEYIKLMVKLYRHPPVPTLNINNSLVQYTPTGLVLHMYGDAGAQNYVGKKLIVVIKGSECNVKCCVLVKHADYNSKGACALDCELQPMKTTSSIADEERAAELLKVNGERWTVEDLLKPCGVVHGVRMWIAPHGVSCEGADHVYCKWHRGFIASYTASIKCFMRHAEQLFLRNPVTRVILTDKRPLSSAHLAVWYKWSVDTYTEHHRLPEELFDTNDNFVGKSVADATEWQNNQCVKYGRKRAEEAFARQAAVNYAQS